MVSTINKASAALRAAAATAQAFPSQDMLGSNSDSISSMGFKPSNVSLIMFTPALARMETAFTSEPKSKPDVSGSPVWNMPGSRASVASMTRSPASSYPVFTV